MANYRIAYFLEDLGHQDIIVSVVKRLIEEVNETNFYVSHDVRNARGGNRVRTALNLYLRDLQAGRIFDGYPDLLIITRDTNRVGRVAREREIQDIIERHRYNRCVVLALPEPYIEAWLFADPQALQRVLSLPRMPMIPQGEPIRERYKQALRQAVKDSGIIAPFGGTEFAEEIVAEMDLYTIQRNMPALGRFIDGLLQVFRAWR